MHSGIVRRIDDLGRIVIPKEIRRIYRIHEGDPLEIIASEGYISLLPYRIKDLFAVSLPLLKAFHNQFGTPAAICDRYEYVAWKGIDLKPRARVSDSLEFHIREGMECLAEQQKGFNAIADSDEHMAGAMFPITADTDKVGGVVLLYSPEQPLTEEEITCARFMAKAISEHLKTEGNVCKG